MERGINNVNAFDSYTIRMIQRLGMSLYGFNYEIATWFGRNRAADWKESGWNGLRQTIEDLQLILAEEIGGYDYYAKAREISVRMM